MSQDTTGYKTAIAKIPQGQLSERQMRIAAAVAMVRDGSSVEGAARSARIPRTTLRRYIDRAADVASTKEQETRTADLLDASFDIANMASEAILESLSTDREAWKPGELVKAYGVATDKTAVLSTQRTSADPGISALAKLLESADVTITKRDASQDAIDVTPDAD